MRTSGWMLTTFLSMIMAAGCSKNAPPPQTASDGPSDPALTREQRAAVDQAHEQARGLHFDDEILRLCPNVRPPKFAYDSARVQQAYRNALSELAKCMSNGDLSGKALLLVGHADPRGEDDYNLALGGRRADSVKSALGSLGVASNRVDVSSRGALEAKGTDESGWLEDRRVDVKLKK